MLLYVKQLVEEYFDLLMDKYPNGKMSIEDFISTFKIAFPERPEDKIHKLATNMANKDDKICNFQDIHCGRFHSQFIFSDGKHANSVLHVLWRKHEG